MPKKSSRKSKRKSQQPQSEPNWDAFENPVLIELAKPVYERFKEHCSPNNEKAIYFPNFKLGEDHAVCFQIERAVMYWQSYSKEGHVVANR